MFFILTGILVILASGYKLLMQCTAIYFSVDPKIEFSETFTEYDGTKWIK